MSKKSASMGVPPAEGEAPLTPNSAGPQPPQGSLAELAGDVPEVEEPKFVLRESPKEDPVVSLVKRQDALDAKLDRVLGLMSGMAQNKPATEQPAKAVPDSFSAPFPKTLEDRVPQTWLVVLEKTLGPDFTYKVNDSNGNFILSMVVPPQFDRRIGLDEVARKNSPDLSTGLIHRGSDIADVMTWAKLWRANLLKESAAYAVRMGQTGMV